MNKRAMISQPMAGKTDEEIAEARDRAHARLREMGYELTRDENQADVILLNTCAIREHAEKRVYGHLGRLSHTKAAKPDQIICLCGCMAQQKVVADKVKNSYHHVDLVLGPQAEWRLPELLHEVYTKNKRVSPLRMSTAASQRIFPSCARAACARG